MSLLQVGWDLGGIGSVNQSLGGSGCSLPVFVALEENWMRYKKVWNFLSESLPKDFFLLVCFLLFWNLFSSPASEVHGSSRRCGTLSVSVVALGHCWEPKSVLQSQRWMIQASSNSGTWRTQQMKADTDEPFMLFTNWALKNKAKVALSEGAILTSLKIRIFPWSTADFRLSISTEQSFNLDSKPALL